MSARALSALMPEQVAAIADSTTIVPLAVPTSERAGGSVRCMLASIRLTARPGP